MEKPAAIYARVSSDRQKESQTIASQTVALTEYAKAHGYLVPAEWVFEDDGYSGASLTRPGLEAVRDLAAQGQIEALLIHSPDRLSRKYAYQVLLVEELARCGVSIVFLKSPSGDTPEDELLLQFQGMIAEYERAQIAERSRRGKRHKAQQGVVNVLSGAPYGYRYVKKSEGRDAYYEVIESEAEVVRMMFDAYTVQGLSINAIARQLNQRQIPTRTTTERWERSTVWGMLRNPAYQGKACFGKTELRPRQRITRPLRQKNRMPSRESASHERPRKDWVEIPVPALVGEETFALAQEQLEHNKHHSPRRTTDPTLLQGMLVCQQCGYALYRTSTRTTKRKINYYRCIGSDGYRRLKGPVCQNRPIRQDYLDAFVWTEVIRLLDDPVLIQTEINRRIEAARNTDPVRKREQSLRQRQARLEGSMGRLVTAYQEELIPLAELRRRMPNLRKQQQAVKSELRSLELAAVDQATYVRLAETLSDFRHKLRARADTLDVVERQKILRLVVKEILVGSNAIRIRHSIPVSGSGPGTSGTGTPAPTADLPESGSRSGSYLLRTGSHDSSLRRPGISSEELILRQNAGFQELHEQSIHLAIPAVPTHPVHQQMVIDMIEATLDVAFDHPLVRGIVTFAVRVVPSSRSHCHPNMLQSAVTSSTRSKTVRDVPEPRFDYRLQKLFDRALHHAVGDRRNPQRSELPRFAYLGNELSATRTGCECPRPQFAA